MKLPQKQAARILNRFTTLPVLLDMLKRKRLVLLDPVRWEDRNDSGILEEYRRRIGVKRLRALCFCCGDETIHQWKTFSDGSSGCCIEFYEKPLLALFEKHGLRHGKVTYHKLAELKSGQIEMEKIPFMKRWPYRCEEEYRVIREDNEKGETFELPISLKYIRKITLSQQMPKTVCDTIKHYLREVCKSPDKRISQSTLYENQIWLQKFKQ